MDPDQEQPEASVLLQNTPDPVQPLIPVSNPGLRFCMALAALGSLQVHVYWVEQTV